MKFISLVHSLFIRFVVMAYRMFISEYIGYDVCDNKLCDDRKEQLLEQPKAWNLDPLFTTYF